MFFFIRYHRINHVLRNQLAAEPVHYADHEGPMTIDRCIGDVRAPINKQRIGLFSSGLFQNVRNFSDVIGGSSLTGIEHFIRVKKSKNP